MKIEVVSKRWTGGCGRCFSARRLGGRLWVDWRHVFPPMRHPVHRGGPDAIELKAAITCSTSYWYYNLTPGGLSLDDTPILRPIAESMKSASLVTVR